MKNSVEKGLKLWRLTAQNTEIWKIFVLIQWSLPGSDEVQGPLGHHPMQRSLEQRRHSEQSWVGRLRLGVIYSGWHSSLIVSNGMSWPQHDKAKCGNERGQDSYLVPMLSYLPCAILDVLRDLCTQRCLHPLLPSEAWVMWKAREAKELPNWPFQHPWSQTAPCGPHGQRKGEGGFSGHELCFLAWQS